MRGALVLLLAHPASALAGTTPRVLTRADVEAAVLRDLLSPEARAAALGKLADVPEVQWIIDAETPGLLSPGPDALSCSTPCTSGILEVTNPYFEAFVDCANGRFSAATGPSHSATLTSGSPQNIFFAGISRSPREGHVIFHLHDDGTSFTDPSGGAACLFMPGSPAEPQAAGAEIEWTVSPLPGVDLVLREEVVVFGSAEADSGIRLTLGATNQATSTAPVTLGLRWFMDTELASDDGPVVATVACEPFSAGTDFSTEHDFTSGEIADFFRARNNQTTPQIELFISAATLADFPDTLRPHRFTHAFYRDPTTLAWDYVTMEGSPADMDAIELLTFGQAQAEAATLVPGEGFSRSVVLLADCDRIESGPCVAPTFTVVVPDAQACEGDAVQLTAMVSNPGRGRFTWTWDFGDGSPPEVVASPVMIVEHAYTMPGTYLPRLVAADAVDVTCTSSDDDTVVVDVRVVPTGSIDDDVRVRKGAGLDVEVLWPTSDVTPPSFALYRTDLASEAVPTPGGIGDEVLLERTTGYSAIDPMAQVLPPALAFYQVLPVDSCGATVFP